MKKIFILTGEPSGDKLASRVISKTMNSNSNIEYLSVGGENLKALGITSIYDLNEVTYLGFTKVLLNIFKIKRKINETVDAIIKFNPDILFSVDSPDFTLRIAKRVKKLKPKIKTIHFVAPQVWIWREYRIKKLKKFLDHILLLFPFEKKYFERENINYTFVGHPLLENDEKSKIDMHTIISKNKKIISIFPGSRQSELNILNSESSLLFLTILLLFFNTWAEYSPVFSTLSSVLLVGFSTTNFLLGIEIKIMDTITKDIRINRILYFILIKNYKKNIYS